jgi:hypothetical protein
MGLHADDEPELGREPVIASLSLGEERVFRLKHRTRRDLKPLRIALPSGTDLYPEISGSHYRCSVRFLVWQDAGTRPIQTTEDVRFTLTTCT